MKDVFAISFSVKLRNLTAELRLLDGDFKSSASLDGATLREFRHALDNIRMTAWTAQELLNARESQKNLQAVISFLTAERLRRFSQMAQDLSGDLKEGGAVWPAESIKDLENSLDVLRELLAIARECERARKVSLDV